jgi:hypothetical protein
MADREISVNLLRKAIIQKLGGDGITPGAFPYPVYAEPVKQGFKKPCFFVAHEETEERKALNYRRRRYNRFRVYFYPADTAGQSLAGNSPENQNEQAFDAGEQLFDVLSYVEINNARYGASNMRIQLMPGSVLCFFVEYNFHIIKPFDRDKMEKLEQKVNAL